tara:strand:- start:186 stop:389 length:204 start_codon:yes stop_codon:yes gene_type:complete
MGLPASTIPESKRPFIERVLYIGYKDFLDKRRQACLKQLRFSISAFSDLTSLRIVLPETVLAAPEIR